MCGAAARRWAAVSLVCLATVLVGWWSKARCLDGGWTAGEQYLEWCYTDVYPLWYAERLDAGAVPYLDHPVEYPVLTGAQMWAAAQAAQRFPPPARARVFYHVTAALGAVFAVGVLALLGWAGLGPARAAWWAAAPTLAAYAFLNWDPAAVFLLTLAVVLHLRGHDGWAGVAAGLGAAALMDKVSRNIYCLVGDGESREGQIWEAMDFIADHSLTNVVPIFNCNELAQSDWVSPQQSAETLAKKAEAFGF
ncbi:MAG: thiamine pyrophosphate-dependent enzyme, partial [Actinomycetota bacterium]|nr:thiamine pyrophosphate-dependent enzyme [Actinomycetota bacterium]